MSCTEYGLKIVKGLNEKYPLCLACYDQMAGYIYIPKEDLDRITELQKEVFRILKDENFANLNKRWVLSMIEIDGKDVIVLALIEEGEI